MLALDSRQAGRFAGCNGFLRQPRVSLINQRIQSNSIVATVTLAGSNTYPQRLSRRATATAGPGNCCTTLQQCQKQQQQQQQVWQLT
jgi:hypothetical protein